MSQQRLEDLVDLPDYFIFKVIVDRTDLGADHFRTLAKQALNREIRADEPSTRPSSGGKYQAHTLRIFVEDVQEIESIYTAFRAQEGVTMVL